jgi:glycosyltransferase involved in cell wall biosynthesis
VTVALPFSGEETFIVPEILEHQRQGHRVTVIPLQPRGPVIHEDARLLIGSTIARGLLSMSVVGYALVETVRAPALVLRSARLLAASRSAPVLLKNLAVFPKGLWLARVARHRGVDHIHAHFASTPATVALVASVVSGIPWSFTAHRWDISENNLLYAKAQTARFARAIDARGSQELAGFVRENEHKVRVIHVGVALPPPPERTRQSPRPLRVLMAARFDEFKGHGDALEGIAHLKANGVDVLLRCVGDGPLKGAFEEYARSLDVLDRVQFPGTLDHQQLLSELRAHLWDVALLPSVETNESREGIPVFLIEAMAAGVPVVATNTGSIPELMRGGAGLFVRQRDGKAIAEALARLAANESLRRQLGDAGIERVRDQFTIEASISALLHAISAGIDGADA